MKKLNKFGFSAVEGLLVLIIVALLVFVGWYVWHGRQIKSITSYDQCVKAGGKTEGSDTIGIHGQCSIYGQKYLDDSYLAWDIGQRYTNISHDNKVAPSIVQNSGLAPPELIKTLKYDNNGCAVNDHKTLAVFKIVKVVQNRYAKLMYGCDDKQSKLDAYMIAVNTASGWKEISPTNQFTNDGVPSCALVNYFKISKVLEPKCFKTQNEKTLLSNNLNP